MFFRRQGIFRSLLFILIAPAILPVSCKKGPAADIVIFTMVSSEDKDPSAGNVIAGIAAVGNDKDAGQPVILSDGFYSAMSPAVSSDGKMMLFSAKQASDDHWAVWEMDLSKSKSRKITSFPEDCYSPAYLPTGRIVFIKQVIKPKAQNETAIFSCKPDGADLRQVTFDPKIYSSVSVLKDGRLLSLVTGSGTEKGKSVITVMRPDGTKNQLFYEDQQGKSVKGRAWETIDGKIILVKKSDSKDDLGELTEITYNNPLHSATSHEAGINGQLISAFPLKSGKILVAVRSSDSEKSGLYEYDPVNKKTGKLIFQSPESDITDVIASEQHVRARKLPSEVDPGVKSGLLLCQDINYIDISAPRKDDFIAAARIRIVGKDSSLGEVNIEKDGSFYLKIKADLPFRIERLDDRGNVIGRSCNWLYLRPNERRGCVGCHESTAIVPDNRIPLAVKNAPVVVPVHIKKVVEKKVDLE